MGLAVADRIASEFTGRLPLSVFPYLLERIIHLRHESSVELPVLSRLIRMDPGLCFMALRLDRSMGSDSQTPDASSVDDVVRRMGLAGIDAITTQALAEQALHGIRHRQALALGWLWRHCLTTALLAQGLAMALNFRPVEEVYVAGLLHDIGKLALFAQTPAACAAMLTDPVQASALLKAEEEVAGSDHGRIGAQLIRRHTGAWCAADTARYHTATASAVKNALPVVQMVWAANRLANRPYPSSAADQTVARLLNLDPQQLDRLSQIVQERVLAVVNELDVVAEVPETHRTADAHTIPLSQAIKTRTVLSSVYGELLKAADRSAINRVLRRSLSVFLGIEAMILFIHAPESGLLVGQFSAGTALPIHTKGLAIPLAASDCLPVICHMGGEAVSSFSNTRRGNLTIIDHQLMAYLGTDGIIGMPVRSGIGDGQGILLLGIDASEWPLIKQQNNLLTAIVTAVAGALAKADQRNDKKNGQAADRAALAASKTRKIVHEINNPLSIIKNYLRVLTLRADEHASDKHELRIIDEEISRVAGLIKSLTSPSEMIPIDLETIDVNATIMDIVGLFRESLPGNAALRLNLDLDSHLPVIASDRNRLKQALINLLKNAMEAMPDGGTILVSTRLRKTPLRNVGDQDKAGHILISVCDDGPGIDERIKNDLFKPNVTSKTGHDGLGLAIVHETVTQLKGALQCQSTPGRGTCFHIELPAGDNGSESGTEMDANT